MDHASLRWLMNFRDAEGMIARWMSRVATYNFELEFRAGHKHGNADGMSHCTQCHPDGCPADGKRRENEPDSDDEMLPEVNGEDWREELRSSP